ncbi:MAG: hypothetical protein RMZ43_013600 [Nostoc sp. CmiVER01]|uniref:hypothetical protein n=1 Tax=Nostoc sp. CmiVER01 TaxID=3075384 RepID=UPI002AD2475C|nr:hypothetical protein [Nostoc sp. CmiVER01]MDZ8124934.1 hypothetical protein [Nostoc sp. CmiVER01]
MKGLVTFVTTAATWAATTIAAIALDYTGIATTQVQVLNVYGQIIGQPVFQTEVLVRVGQRQQGGGQVEFNPFNLIVSPSPAYSNANGAISIASALVSTAPTAGPLLVQYWTIAYDQATGATNATLTNPANELAFSSNLINVPSEIAPNIIVLPFPLAMAQGTVLSGVINANTVDITINGNTVDAAHPFITRIQANVTTQ